MLMKITKIFQKMKKTKSKNMVKNTIKISQKIKNKSQLSIEKDIMKCKKIKERVWFVSFWFVRLWFVAITVKIVLFWSGLG